MSFTYTGDPTTSPKDEVRFLIGDVNMADPELSDAEIIYCISTVYGSMADAPAMGNYLPAAYAADNLASKYARQADKSVGDLHIAYGNRFKQFQQLALRLRARATNALIPPWAGGELYTDKAVNLQDQNVVGTAVTIDGMDYILPDKRLGGENGPGDGPLGGPGGN
jgi:hypothetical protein